MKRFLRTFLIELFALYVAMNIATGLEFQESLKGVLITAAALAAASYVIKPIINILILPITLATMGIFKFIGHAITLYIVDVGLNYFKVTGFHFAGYTSPYADIPPMNFNQGIFAYLAFAFVLSFITSFLHWLCKK